MSTSYVIIAYYDDYRFQLFRFICLSDMLDTLKELKKSNKYKTFGTYKRFTVK